jgi:hypothetical protein
MSDDLLQNTTSWEIGESAVAIPWGVQQFLDHDPNNVDNPSQGSNFQFYYNQQWSRSEWGRLPTDVVAFRSAMNSFSQPLQEHEIHAIKASVDAMIRILRS